MSFIIAVHVVEGIVLASDRKVTFTNTSEQEGKTIIKVGIHTSNTTDKTFICPNGAGISTCGDATVLNKPIAGFIQNFIQSKIESSASVDDIPQKLIDFFSEIAGSNLNTNFIVAGYTKSSEEKISEQKLYKVQLATKTIQHIDCNNQGAIWDGETTTLLRLFKNVAIKEDDGTYRDLPQEEVLWNYFTLQDAVDFARYSVLTTINTMKFKNVIETVGGNIDVLLIKPKETKWINKEHLK